MRFVPNFDWAGRRRRDLHQWDTTPQTKDRRIPADRDAAAWIPSITTDRLRPTMSRPDTIARLKAVPLFQNCSARQLRRIANLGRESTFEAGRNLCEEGKFSKEFFVILEGQAEVRRGGRKRGTLGSGGLLRGDRAPALVADRSESPYRDRDGNGTVAMLPVGLARVRLRPQRTGRRCEDPPRGGSPSRRPVGRITGRRGAIISSRNARGGRHARLMHHLGAIPSLVTT